MREFLSTHLKRMLTQILLCTIIIGSVLCVYGKISLLTGVVTGYFLAVICAWIMAYRTWRASFASSIRMAKFQMWVSLIMRLVIICIILRSALMQSMEFFLATLGGFFLAFTLYMVHLMIFAYHQNMK